MQWFEGTFIDTTEIIDVDNRTHQCVDSAPPLPYPLMLAMGGLLHDKYPLICGGAILGNLGYWSYDFTDQCHVIDVEGNMIAPSLPVKIAYSGYAVVNNSWLWITGGSYLNEDPTSNITILQTNASWYIFTPSQNTIYAYVGVESKMGIPQ